MPQWVILRHRRKQASSADRVGGRSIVARGFSGAGRALSARFAAVDGARIYDSLRSRALFEVR